MRRYHDELAPRRVCIVAADAVRARLFEAGKPRNTIKELDTLVNPDGRNPDRKLASDRPGRTFSSTGRRKHAYSERTSPHREAVEVFARRISQRLKAARTTGRYERIYLVAEPEILGMIRQSLDTGTRKYVAGVVSKSVTRRSAKTIRASLPERL